MNRGKQILFVPFNLTILPEHETTISVFFYFDTKITNTQA
jgi:hypothetical protein